jgi:hypothetical protein
MLSGVGSNRIGSVRMDPHASSCLWPRILLGSPTAVAGASLRKRQRMQGTNSLSEIDPILPSEMFLLMNVVGVGFIQRHAFAFGLVRPNVLTGLLI